MSDVHTKNQGPGSKNGLVRAYPRPFFQKIRLSVGVLEIEKMKKKQSHRISAKILILNAPPMSDIHTKNQGPSSKNGLVRAYPRPFFQKALGTLDLNRRHGQ